MIVGVLLAAGRGTRFGAHKLLQRMTDGVMIAEHAARNLVTALPCSVAVIRPGDVELRDLLTGLGLAVVECATAAEGMGASIACGVSAAPNADGWMITLADMPWIRPQTIFTLAQHLRFGADMVAPLYQAQRGHPVGFAATYKASLSALRFDAGARAVIEAGHEHLVVMQTNDAGVVLDIDVPSDVQRNIPTSISKC